MATRHTGSSSTRLPFHPIVARWFLERFGEPTDAQRLGWPAIGAGRHTLIVAPTGSGKTLAAFLTCIDALLRQAVEGDLEDATQVVYVSPLKALASDIERNLSAPLQEIQELARSDGLQIQPVRALVRTGDTSASARAAMLRRPPHILVTTPESLYLVLTAPRARQTLRHTRTVIVDEIHAIARDKRGAHLALSLERLETLVREAAAAGGTASGRAGALRQAQCAAEAATTPRGERAPGGRVGGTMPETLSSSGSRTAEVRTPQEPPILQRIGLSATVKPAGEIARFLVGCGNIDATGDVDAAIVDAGASRELDLAIEVPPSPLSAVCPRETWDEIDRRLAEIIAEHRSTLVFVHTRRLAERLGHRLRTLLGEDAVASHHGSLARPIRQSAEDRVRAGQLKAIVATASLELGIDIGFIDLVCQIGAPRSIATFLQRVGRSGHSLGRTPRGRIFPLTRDELLESMALVKAVRAGELDAVQIPSAPVDILAQQIVAETATADRDETALYDQCRKAWPYRALTRESFDETVRMLAGGFAEGRRRDALVTRDALMHTLRARRGARILASTSGGAIPEMADYRVITESDGTLVGMVNEDFAIESIQGDVFQLGNASWRVRHVRQGEVVVTDAGTAPANIPFWLGEAPARTRELSEQLSALRSAIDSALDTMDETEAAVWLERQIIGENPPATVPAGAALTRNHGHVGMSTLTGAGTGASPWAARQAVAYVAAQRRAAGTVPTTRRLLVERFFDEMGGLQIVIHAPLGARINRAWGYALRKKFCRTFDFELQASADDDGIALSLGPQHSFPLDLLPTLVKRTTAVATLEQAVLASPLFTTRWRWNATRALAVPRFARGRKVPPAIQRFRADDLLVASFPAQTACQDNRVGDVAIPDHPLVRQSLFDCLHEAMDVDGWLRLLSDLESGALEVVTRDTPEPSPFAHRILNANPYAFLDDAPLEERRARAVSLRRTLPETSGALLCLDPVVVARVRDEAAPMARDAQELHDALDTLLVLPAAEGRAWTASFDALRNAGRAACVTPTDGTDLWVASEHVPLTLAAYPGARVAPPVRLPPELDTPVTRDEALARIVRARMEIAGPTSAAALAAVLQLEASTVARLLEGLEAQGAILRGHFTTPRTSHPAEGHAPSPVPLPAFVPVPVPVPACPSSFAGATPTAPQDSRITGLGADLEWCERRLLARIHRLTLDALRRQIEPVPVDVFVRFLLEHQHLTDRTRLSGRRGLGEVIAQLQGFEAPAGTWEPDILARRVTDYACGWLDELSHQGVVAWGRLAPPRRDAAASPAAGPLTRVIPISLAIREDLDWLLPPDRLAQDTPLHARAARVRDALRAHGALFASDLARVAGLMPTEVDEALGTLASLGHVTSDGFASIRTIATGQRRRRDQVRHRARTIPRMHAGSWPQGGRWSIFPGQVRAWTGSAQVSPMTEAGDVDRGASHGEQAGENAHGAPRRGVVGSGGHTAPPASAGRGGDRPGASGTSSGLSGPSGPPDARSVRSDAYTGMYRARVTRAERWVWQLLSRYGVLVRDLALCEPVAPPWPALVGAARLLEAQGQIRGGRFVAGIGGEQFALPTAVERLRQIRDSVAAAAHGAPEIGPLGEPHRESHRGSHRGPRPAPGRALGDGPEQAPELGPDRWPGLGPGDAPIVLSAADPLNLAGILGPSPRVPAVHTHRVLVVGGRFVASLRAGELQLHEPLAPTLATRARELLTAAPGECLGARRRRH